MKGEKKRKRDNAIAVAISGDWSTRPNIEDNYLKREREENLREQGFEPTVPLEPYYSDKERIIRKSEKDMEEVENQRTNKLASLVEKVREEGAREKGWPEREVEGCTIAPQKMIVRHESKPKTGGKSWLRRKKSSRD